MRAASQMIRASDYVGIIRSGARYLATSALAVAAAVASKLAHTGAVNAAIVHKSSLCALGWLAAFTTTPRQARLGIFAIRVTSDIGHRQPAITRLVFVSSFGATKHHDWIFEQHAVLADQCKASITRPELKSCSKHTARAIKCSFLVNTEERTRLIGHR